ncbi:hypothetical protein EIH07_10650 [Chryseobacterium taklimakanense]|uniref:helix-turn-helix domain-containing protein n=1 Tax=Chryseobacterium taklimakanense TaxID=536441 RepID=UPI000F5EB4C1|nr:helix-turn-helix domain-containing protein [Chryseobacterium taklimakanense]AZI23461.1 hypothetical protein EIH07_10650 [Chryseobacterium taklimakanense]
MKKSRFTEPQMLKVLQSQQEGKKVAEISREFGFSEQTFYNCQSKIALEAAGNIHSHVEY